MERLVYLTRLENLLLTMKPVTKNGYSRSWTWLHRSPSYPRRLNPRGAKNDYKADAEAKIPNTSPNSPPPRPERSDTAKTEIPDLNNDIAQDRYGINSNEDADVLQQLLHVDEQHKPLLVLLEQFSPGEDGIQFNRKLRHFESSLTTLYPEEARLIEAFLSLRAAALVSAATTRKLAAVGASFCRQPRRQVLRSALLNAMQSTYSKLDVLQRANPQLLVNAANLMGDYFSEARLQNGNKVQVLAVPLVQYMRALLASDDVRAHRSLATQCPLLIELSYWFQLMQNGTELLSYVAQGLEDLAISIRIRLLSPPPKCTIWLLLSSDICLNKFLPLPNSLQQFYASHLDLNQGADSNPGYSEVNYGSWKKSPEESLANISLSDSSPEIPIDKLAQFNISHDDKDVSKPKLRPILGAGAGLLRQEQTQAMTASQDSYDAWTPKSGLGKRYDLNSWRQNEEEKEIETAETVFNPSVLPPAVVQSYPQNIVPDYPPPNMNYPVQYVQDKTYLQQGDGQYIQNVEFPSNDIRYTPQTTQESYQQSDASFMQYQNQDKQTPPAVDKKKPVENWRKEKNDKDETKKNWSRQKSKDNLQDTEEKKEVGAGDGKTFMRSNSRSSEKSGRGSRSKKEGSDPPKQSSRRHVTDVPRSQKYWDHDDRCDKDYNS
ncbi:hypothetical protein EVAR_14736_1 [Eumeta japonica]|uniref:Uncharacterized protein n=1 Tax=Eumeta variegata TaxID=151549 RepID=A0A4C1TWB7_EUMVA|nr:hypothetical protein EVAR_14736_1 [Eumeta japonica]